MIDAYGIINNDLYLRMVLIILFIMIGLINCIKDIMNKIYSKDNLFYVVFNLFSKYAIYALEY